MADTRTWVGLGAVGLGGYLILTQLPSGLEAQGAFWYALGAADPHERAAAIQHLQALAQQAQKAGQTAIAQTLTQWATALGASTSSGGGSSTGGGSSSGQPAQPTVPRSTPTPTGPDLGACPNQTLRFGSRGACVATVQTALNYWAARRVVRIDNAPLTVDGIFGPETLAAVEQFQAEEGLTVDGVVGPQTWGRLQQPSPYHPPAAPAPAPRGSSNPYPFTAPQVPGSVILPFPAPPT
jgi:hypothetical protein